MIRVLWNNKNTCTCKRFQNEKSIAFLNSFLQMKIRLRICTIYSTGETGITSTSTCTRTSLYLYTHLNTVLVVNYISMKQRYNVVVQNLYFTSIQVSYNFPLSIRKIVL